VTYVGDITYLPLATGSNLYLATVIDCCSRRVTGWAIADHMRTELVEDALHAAAALRGSLAGAVFHSDHGSQYTSRDFATLCRELRVTQSMGGVGSSADNALAESFHATLKREVLQDRRSWADAASCRREVFRWRARYNTQRRHSHCRHTSPRHLRTDPHTRYAARSRVITNPVSTTWGQGPALAVILLLAVGADYNLLLISRFKEEIGAGLKTGNIRAMAGTAG
jgi:transposase InsO family protein